MTMSLSYYFVCIGKHSKKIDLDLPYDLKEIKYYLIIYEHIKTDKTDEDIIYHV